VQQAVDQFDERYVGGIVPSLVEARVVGGRPQAGTVTTEPWCLKGCVITPDRRLEPGWVVVEGTSIADVTGAEPDGVRCLDTGGVILPGLIDLHGHPEYNVFAPWEPPNLYPNRYAWRDSVEYDAVVKQPWQWFGRPPSLHHLLSRYAEIRAVIGGTTAIQGASQNYPLADHALVRHVDLAPFGRNVVASMVDPLTEADWAAQMRAEIRDGIAAGTIKRFYAHLAEGVDERSRDELAALEGYGLLGAATVLIHGTALTGDQLDRVRSADASLVWSPQSNLRLYGSTTRAAEARRLGIPVGLGADWLPSGSVSLLGEMQVARRALAEQGAPIEARELVQTVTSRAASIAGLGEFIGELHPGRRADVLVLERRRTDPYEAVGQSDRSSVALVAIDGKLIYGRDEWFTSLAPDHQAEAVLAWGRRMRLDVSAHGVAGEPSPLLREIRTALIGRYPQIGPILA
jgi:5-methylthioadenosine/S-adenosylhomocysteine deaminase